MDKFKNIKEYIEQYDDEIKERLLKIKKTILDVDSSLEQRMSWQMPTFWKKVNIIHFAAGKNHIGVYPGPDAIIRFEKELKDFKTSKGAIQFQNDKPIPYDLISKIVKYNLNKVD